MSFEIYRIYTTCAPNNEYKINRHEEWTTSFVKKFDSLEEAKIFVIEKNKEHSELPNFSYNIKDECKKKEFYEQFCFSNDKYLKYRRFFIGKPPIKQIENELKKDGIKIVKDN